MNLLGAASVLAGYLLGSIPFGYLLVKRAQGQDVRASGSGSIGASNVTRAAGLLAGLLTLALDVGKGYGAVALAAWLTGEPKWMASAGFVAIVGHSFPVFLGFRGGKSVATGAGVFLYFTPVALAGALGVWAVAVGIWRYISLGSILAAAAFPLLAFSLQQPPLAVSVASVAGACLIILRHQENIRRLIGGTEPKLELRRRK